MRDGVGREEGPGLGGAVFFEGVVLDVFDGAVDVSGGIEIDVPTFVGPRGMGLVVALDDVGEGMEFSIEEGLGGLAFELVACFFDFVAGAG